MYLGQPQNKENNETAARSLQTSSSDKVTASKAQKETTRLGLLSAPHITKNQAPPKGDELSITKSPESSGDLKEAPVDGSWRVGLELGSGLGSR